MKQKNLDKFQKDLGNICAFLGMELCKSTEYEPQKCLHGDYTMCEKYQELYEGFVNKFDTHSKSVEEKAKYPLK